jgi:hypothetical protein
MNLRHVSQATALVALTVALSTQVLAADAGKCQRYANLADKDSLYRERSYPQIPYDAKWRRDRSYHYNWCLNAPDAALEAESEARRQDLIGLCGVITKWTQRDHF